MAAPKKVKEKAALAEKLIAQSANTPKGDPQAAPSAPKPELAVVTDPVAAPKAPEAPRSLEGNPYAVPQGQATTAEPVTEDWRHKYNVLQGMFDKSRSESSERISQLENQIGLLTTMAQQPQTTYQDTFHPTVPQAPHDPTYGLTEEQIEEMGGQEFVDFVGQISAAGAASQIAELKQELGNIRETQTETEESIFYSRLTELSPNWRAINKDPRFDEWLNDGEGLSGIARKNFLTNAYDNRDAETSARYFNQFAELLPREPGLDNPNTITDFVPDTTGGGAPPGANSVFYTPESIQAFFKDRGLGRWKGREDEAAAIERDIFAAQKEGRIMPAGGRRSA
jgi:hypothetical protein